MKGNLREITRLYFGEERLNEPTSLSRQYLTPSGRYILTLARKQLSEEELSPPSEKKLHTLISDLEEQENEQLTDRERTAVIAALQQSFLDFGLLAPLIEDHTVNDIIVRRFDDISVQKGRLNYQTGLTFENPEDYRAFVEQLLKRAKKACTVSTPVIDASLGENIRLCVTHESLAPTEDGPFLTIRIARHSTVSLASLHHFGLAPALLLDYLSALMHSGLCSLLVAGEVGTGKTTLVRALAQSIPETDSILIIEDTEEIKLQHPFVRTLLTREANTEGFGRVAPATAIRAGMRMAMNRIILGEMRDAEAAESFIDVCASGHPGLSTIHARSARDALSRLELFLGRAQPGVRTETIQRQIANAVSVVIYLGVCPETRVRRILEIAELGSSSEGCIQLSPLFRFESSQRVWRRLSGVSRFSEILANRRVVLPLTGEQLAAESL